MKYAPKLYGADGKRMRTIYFTREADALVMERYIEELKENNKSSISDVVCHLIINKDSNGNK